MAFTFMSMKIIASSQFQGSGSVFKGAPTSSISQPGKTQPGPLPCAWRMGWLAGNSGSRGRGDRRELGRPRGCPASGNLSRANCRGCRRGFREMLMFRSAGHGLPPSMPSAFYWRQTQALLLLGAGGCASPGGCPGAKRRSCPRLRGPRYASAPVVSMSGVSRARWLNLRAAGVFLLFIFLILSSLSI